ncbi:hypothetical protein GIB67_002491 [Kingdonia uniflora]|uniref:Phosphorylated adapter RNA export protein n=1 Tax=Kingdonia uniflora TaxID=39325 RepID=A0A7J7LAJ4_9MAGN|nr:hypothetical protein GIB67_002491 [Kingdonia uniflora]
MEGGESILEVIYEDETLEDVDMLDAESLEEGECEEQKQCIELSEVSGKHIVAENKESNNESRLRGPKRKRNKKKKKSKIGSNSDVKDLNRFVLDTCRRLKEKKSYLVWNAVGCLGVSALSDLVKEVEAVQACGGQMTTDGRRYRFGGGILWNILKKRDPKAYKEIMAKGRELEKQFRQQNSRTCPNQDKELPSETFDYGSSYEIETLKLEDPPQLQVPDKVKQTDTRGDRTSVLSRIRVPVTYDDLFEDDPKVEPADCSELKE